jgi:hypothetical protein
VVDGYLTDGWGYSPTLEHMLSLLNHPEFSEFVQFLKEEEAKDQGPPELGSSSSSAAAAASSSAFAKPTPVTAKRFPGSVLRGVPTKRGKRRAVDRSGCTPTTLSFAAATPEGEEEEEEEEEDEDDRLDVVVVVNDEQ